LTPLWTGGADGKCDRVHVTGIVGSLRWWYEALVRGLGGYACDPAADSGSRDAFDTDAFAQARRDKRPESEALQKGIQTLCPACYLFGATGWARLFQLQVVEIPPKTPLHFRSPLPMNQSWLSSVFGGEAKSIAGLQVPHGQLRLRLVPRGHDHEFALSQALLALRLAVEFGGLGAKLQHGFGQVALVGSQAPADGWEAGLNDLARRLESGGLLSEGPEMATPYDLRRLVSLDYEVPAQALAAFSGRRAHLGPEAKRSEAQYLPCAFDLRYKGTGNWGFRRWLEDPLGAKRWSHSKVNALMGVSKKKNEPQDDDDRQASRLCFGMPYRVAGDRFRLRVFGFAPHGVVTPPELRDLCNEYVAFVLGVREPVRATLGQDLIAELRR
jgi:CRISPR type III-B/RAMP module RAMP protein Cmr1